MAMLLDVNDFCRFCQEHCRLGGTLSNTKKIWETKDPDDVFHRLLKIGLILQPRDQKSSRICRKCFRFILRIEESLSTLQKWKSAEEENVSQEETPKEVKREIDLPPTPDRTQPTTQCLTEVMIPYPTKQICPTPVVGIVESVCKGHWAKAANLIMKLDALAEKIKECVLTAVDKECKTICHYEQDCMLWRCSPQDLKALSFDKMESDLQRLAPFLFSLLSTITNRSPPQICAAASIAMRGRNPRLSAFAYHINGVLFDAGAKEAVFEGLSKFGISTSHYSAVKKQHSLEDISGDELQRLTAENELHLKPQPGRTEDTESDSDEEEDVSSVSVNMEETYSSEAESSETEEMPAVFDHAQRVLSSLNQQRATGRFCDAALNVGNGVVHLAHRNILACFSDLFQQPNQPPAPGMELCLQECPNDGLELLLNFVYTGELKLDPKNLDKVQNAAASLCVPEALVLCQQFKETSADPGPFKRKRGRPRKSILNTTTHSPVKEESLPKITNVESIVVDTAKASFSTATTTTTSSQATTTRCGRVVKGPKRLVTDERPTADLTAPEKSSKKSPVTPTEGEVGEVLVEKPNPDRPSGETKELQSDMNDKVVSEVIEEDDEEDDVGELDDGAPLDTDEEYVPVAEPSSSASSTATARKRKAAQSKADREENGEAAEEDSKKDCVQCPTCDKSFKSKYYLKVHNRRHTGERPFGCLKCGKRYFRKENLLIHEIRDCSKVQTLSCETCAETFNSKEELRMHVFSHTGEMPHKCSICNEQFLYKKNLTTHMMKVHGHPKPHACPQCPKTFLTRTELRVHEAAKHRGEKPFVCEECGHRASSRNGLQMHIKAIHRNERPFVCSLCGHAFSQKNNLNMHLRIHSGERPYQCHLCGKTFRTQASLDKHNRTHTGERPFPCDVCEQRFTEKGALVRHKASKHEEGRPHCCHICGKTFKAKEQFRVHLRRHKGMRKFECTDCGYKFTRQSHLRRHTQIHKRTENYNPRQRKLRNVIVTDVNRSPDGNEDIDAGETSLIAGETDYVTETADTQESTTNSIVRVVIESEDVAPNQNPGSVEGAETFPVPADVLQPTQLDTEAYEPTIDMEGMVEGISEGKT